MRVDNNPSRLSMLFTVTLAVLFACTDASPATTTDEERSPAAPASSSPGGAGQIDLASLGGRIVFSAGPPCEEDIFVINADGTGLRRVTTDPAADFDPTWSPDGEQIAYRHQTGDDRTTDIHVIGADGTGELDLTRNRGVPDWGPAWSPDGAWIAWNTAAEADFGFDLGLVHADGTGRTLIKPGVFVEYPAWSPDGERIAFMSQVAEEASQYDIFVMNADGTNVQRLTDFRGDDGWPSWSPDGTRILFSSIRDDCAYSDAPDCKTTGDIGPYHTLYVMDANGSGQIPVSDAFGQIADWSPDGRFIVFEDFEGRAGLSVIRVDGSGLTTIPISFPNAGFPDWIA